MGILRYSLLAYTRTREGASVTKTIPWNAISYLDRLSVHILFGGICGSAVKMSFRHMSIC